MSLGVTVVGEVVKESRSVGRFIICLETERDKQLKVPHLKRWYRLKLHLKGWCRLKFDGCTVVTKSFFNRHFIVKHHKGGVSMLSTFMGVHVSIIILIILLILYF